MAFTTESFKQLVIKTFVLSRGALGHQYKIIEYIVSFYTPTDFKDVDFALAFKEVRQRFNDLNSKGNHPIVMSDPGVTIGDAIKHFEDSIKQQHEDLVEYRKSLMYDLLLGFLERDAYYLSESNEEARQSARKSDFRDKILKVLQSESDEPTSEIWRDLHNYFENILNKKIDLGLREEKDLFEAISKVSSRWVNYFKEIPFFADPNLGEEIKKLSDESKLKYFNKIS
ncbi:MAG: hypothetical protein ACMG57_00495 [Candidatus Dojkabacteria bacterium]